MNQYIFPIVLATLCYSKGQLPSVAQGICFLPTVVWLIGVPMSICLHRYFSHGAFTTSRLVQAMIGVVGCLAYQGGPLWWAAKHVRHHHHCDQPNDPHSVVQQGYFYAFVGWTMNPINMAERDASYNNSAHFVPELQFLDKFYLAPAAILFSLLEKASEYGYGTDRAFIAYSVLLPMLFCRLITLLFNVEYHPAHDPHRCKSVDNPRLLALLVGEAEHDVHHKFPKKARRSQLDPPCKLFLFLGLLHRC
jgi:stearoyl-CoA desaturase (Delta-9 desaturase)